MLLSGRSRDGSWRFIADVDAVTGERENSMPARPLLSSLAVVKDPGFRTATDADPLGAVEDALQAAMVPAWPVQVAVHFARVPGDRGDAGRRQPIGRQWGNGPGHRRPRPTRRPATVRCPAGWQSLGEYVLVKTSPMSLSSSWIFWWRPSTSSARSWTTCSIAAVPGRRSSAVPLRRRRRRPVSRRCGSCGAG